MIYSFGPFGSPIYRQETKNISKTKVYAKTASLGISSNVSLKSQKNCRILVKLSKAKKHFFGPKFKLCLNWPLGLRQRVIRNSDITYNTTMVIILWGFIMFYQIFVLPRVKQNLIISNKLVYTSSLTSCPTI